MNATPHYADGQATLHLGEALDVLPAIPDGAVDAIVCDPPYGLADHHPRVIATALAAWLAGDRSHVPDGRGFMGHDWDRFVPPPAVWDQCLRVLKPGGHLLAFAAPKTADLMGLSIRLAGFEIRDSLHWITGSGFPKSLDVSKAIDAAAGAVREVVGQRDRYRDGLQRQNLGGRTEVYDGGFSANGVADLTVPATREAADWSGWGTALKPAHEPIVLARKPLAGTVAATVLAHGTGALNIDGCRTVSGQDYRDKCASVVGLDSNRNGDAYGEWTGAREDSAHTAGRWPTNVLLTHQPLLNDEGQVIGDACTDGCVPDCPVADMDRQTLGTRASKPSKSGSAGTQREAIYGGGKGMPRDYVPISRDDAGGASRFFPVFRYEAKAPASERPRLPDGTAHPTVKPLALMRWLVRLVTPPGGVVLDWCAGTGTTLEACVIEGFPSVGIERHEPYADLCVTRLSKPIALDLFGGGAA